jgi:hypothetical protein
MSDEFPHQSPFAYCSNYPVMRIDPDGMYDEPTNDFQRAWNFLTDRKYLNQFADLRQNIESNGLGTVSNVDFSQRGTISYDFTPNAEAFEMRNADVNVDGTTIPVTDNVSTVRLVFGGSGMNTIENYFDVRTDVGGTNPITGGIKGSGLADIHFLETDIVPQLRAGKGVGKSLGLAKGKGERGKTRSAGGTASPYKHMQPDPNKPGNVLQKDTHTGKKVSKPAPPGFQEYWNNK